MKVNVIATGSKGNLYEIIDNTGNSMLIEAGVPRQKYIKFREGINPPEMCIISHAHGDHSQYRNHYEMICPVHKWRQTASSQNFKAFGFEVIHGDILNYAYIIKLIADNDYLFFGTDMEWDDEKIKPIISTIKGLGVSKFLLEVNYNDYLYHLADEEQRRGCDRHFSDNNAIKFVKQSGMRDPKIITIHGSDRLSADTYTRKMIKSRIPNAIVAVSVGAKNGVKNLYNL